MPPAISRPGGETPQRSKSAASTKAKAAHIFRGQVTNVNIRDYTVDVVMESYPHSNYFDIPWMVPYLHQNQGEGINPMPEVASTVWICQPSEEGKDAFVLGWTPISESGTYRAGRELMNPGDLHFSTRDANFIFLRRGGIVQIGATPVCQRIYIPIRNIIRDFAENYELSTPAGDLTWEVLRDVDSGDGHQGCLFTLACHEFADDPITNPLATLKIGSHGDGNATILTLETRDSGGGSVKTSLTIDKSGNVSWTIQNDVSLTINGNLTATIGKKMTVSSTQDMSFSSSGQITAKGSQVHASGGGATLDLATVAALNGAQVLLGDGIFPVVIENGSLAAWIAGVTLLLSGAPGSIAFQGVLPPPLYLSTKAKG